MSQTPKARSLPPNELWEQALFNLYVGIALQNGQYSFSDGIERPRSSALHTVPAIG